MNGSVVVAQAIPAGSTNAMPVRVIKLLKPASHQAQVIEVGYGQDVKIDFSAIADEKLTLVHVGETLVIIYDNQATQTIQPFYDSMGVPLANITVEMAPGRDLPSGEFASLFPITTDQSLLPAASDVQPLSGADFSDPSIAPLSTPQPLPLLGSIDFPSLPGLLFDPGVNTNAAAASAINQLPTIAGVVSVVVEEEALRLEETAAGAEDTDSQAGGDSDTSAIGPDSLITTQSATGTLAGLVTGGDLPVTFLINGAADGAIVKDGAGNTVTSLGLDVTYVVVDSTTVQGRASDERLIFTLTVDPDGTFSFTLENQIDHPDQTNDDGTAPTGALEETLFIDLSAAVTGQDGNGDPIVLPALAFTVGAIDDTPIAHVGISEASRLELLELDETIGADVYGSADTIQDDNGEVDDTGQMSIDGVNAIGSITSAAGFLSGLFSVDFEAGADGARSVNYDLAFALSTNGARTSLVATLPTIGGNPDSDGIGGDFTPYADATVYLFRVDAHTIEGRVGNDANGPLALTITLNDSDATVFGDETVTFAQYLAVDHTPDGNAFDSQAFLTLAEDTLDVTLTARITDRDGDSATGAQTVTLIGISSPFAIDDDGPAAPSIDVSGNAPILLTFDGGVADGNFVGADSPDDSDGDPAVAMVDFSAAFSISNFDIFGVDGAGATTVTYALGFAADFTDGDDSGLTSGEQVIHLYAVDGTIVGSTAFNASEIDSDNTIFTLAVDAATGGVTLTQSHAVDHSVAETYEGDYRDDLAVLGEGVIELTANAVTTDSEGDTTVAASAALDFGGNVQFGDDGPSAPSIDVTGITPILLTFDGGVADGNFVGTDSPDDADDDPAIATVDFSGAFTLSDLDDFGADGPGATSITYALGFATNFTDGDDSDLTSGGATIHLFAVDGAIVGSTAFGADGIDPDNTIFTLAIDATTGIVTLTQSNAVDHSTPETYEGAYLEDLSVLGEGLITLTASAVITDSEGDTTVTASTTLDLGGTIQFGDDGPEAPSINLTGIEPILLTVDDQDDDDEHEDDHHSGHSGDEYSDSSEDGPSDLTVASVDFSNAFAIDNTGDYGADGPGATTVTYAFRFADGFTEGDDSGLTSDDQTIRLYETDGVIFGSTAETEAEIDSDNTIFTLGVDANGVVTLTQLHSVDSDDSHDDHGDGDDYGHDEEAENEDVTLLGDGIIELVASAVTTDSEGDSTTIVSSALDLGGNVQFGAAEDDDSDLHFAGNSLLNAGTNGVNTTVANNAILFTVAADDPSGVTYSFDGSATAATVVGASNETLTMDPTSGVARTTGLAFSEVHILTLTTPTAESADETETETVTVVLGLNNADDTIDRSGFDEDHVIYGFGGNDAITAGRGDDWIKGGAGIDTIDGGRGNDTIVLANNDFAAGESIDGGRDRDTILLANATLAAFTLGTITDIEALVGSSGNDRLTTSTEQWAAFSDIDLGDGTGDQLTVNVNGTVDISGEGSPTLAGIEIGRLTGNDSDDAVTVTGEQLDAILIGAGIINLGTGTDTIRLLSTSGDLNTLGAVANANVQGVEEISAADAQDGVVITLSAQTEAFAITGSSHDDVITTGSGADRIDGGDGNDMLNGGAGQDLLFGDGGADALLGGNGDDILFADTSDDVDGGANASNNLLTAANRGDVLAIGGDFDFTTLDNIFANIETLSMLNSEFGTGNDTITLSIDDVFDMAGTGVANPGGSAPGGGAYDQRPTLRIDGDTGDIVNLADDTGSWLPATGATGIPAGYTAYAHVTSGSIPGQNEDAYLFVLTGVTLNAA